jgi:hypothetical protein
MDVINHKSGPAYSDEKDPGYQQLASRTVWANRSFSAPPEANLHILRQSAVMTVSTHHKLAEWEAHLLDSIARHIVSWMVGPLALGSASK